MIRRYSEGGVPALVLALLVAVPSQLGAATTPAKPSYSDQWMQGKTRSSPFLELRNERDTGPQAHPQPPDTPTVAPVDPSGASEDTSGSRSELTGEQSPGDETDETGEAAPENDRANPSTAAETTPVGETDSPEAMVESSDTATGDSGGSPPPQRASRSRRETREAVTGMLTQLAPEEPGGSSPPLQMVSDKVTLHEINLTIPSFDARTAEPTPDRPGRGYRWWPYRYWILAGLVVSLMTGIFFWFRRRRVTVVERNYPSAEEFFGDEIKRVRAPDSGSPDPRVRRTPTTEETDPSEPVHETPPESLTTILNSYGIEDEHQALVDMYFDKGLTRREVAEQSSLGDGEVGLVLDLADRLKEDTADGEGA